jgi:predicted DNA-binding helix-hairpin-helix protein
LDFGLSYVRAQQGSDRYLIAKERERKAVHNLMQDVRTAYWRAVSAQRLLDRVEPLASRVSIAIENSRQIELEQLENPLEALQFQRDLLDIQRNLGWPSQRSRRCEKYIWRV